MVGTRVSVVVCTKDRSNMLRLCLESILRNSLLPYEIVVVDQSVDDRTAAVVDQASVMSGCPIRRIQLDSTGLSIARNIGVKAALGEVIAFTDDDCDAAPGWVEAIVQEFVDETVGCVCGHVYPADHKQRPRQTRISTLSNRPRSIVTGKCNPFLVGRGNNMAFRKSDLEKLGMFNEYIGVGSSVYAGEDLDILYRLMEVGGRIVHTPDAIVYHAQPDEWESVIKKKRGYAIAASAILASRARHGDIYAGLLVVGKMFYEFGCLFCGGALRANLHVARVGWHSMIGSFSGIKHAFDPAFQGRVKGLTQFARDSYSGKPTTAHKLARR